MGVVPSGAEQALLYHMGMDGKHGSNVLHHRTVIFVVIGSDSVNHTETQCLWPRLSIFTRLMVQGDGRPLGLASQHVSASGSPLVEDVPVALWIGEEDDFGEVCRPHARHLLGGLQLRERAESGFPIVFALADLITQRQPVRHGGNKLTSIPDAHLTPGKGTDHTDLRTDGFACP